jgi:hypothetical protein
MDRSPAVARLARTLDLGSLLADVADFSGEPPAILASSVTEHWFDPCELLRPGARSELRPEFRTRQHGGGWEHADANEPACGRRRGP